MTGQPTDRDLEVRELLDKQAIRDVLARYCRGVDRCDAALISSCYHPDARDNHASRSFTGETVGAGIVEWMSEAMEMTTHHITTQTIRIHGDMAGCESYYTGIHTPKGPDRRLLLTCGRYVDRFERRDGDWRIIDRVVVLEAAHSLPAKDAVTGLDGEPARRDRNDPSYMALGSPAVRLAFRIRRQLVADFDVLVVGSGIAGLCAALEAGRAGASVLLIEADTVLGGSSRFSSGVVMAAGTSTQAARGIQDTADDLYHHYMTINQWKLEPSLVRRLTLEASGAVDWLIAEGVTIKDLYYSGDELAPRGHVTGGGNEIVEVLAGHIRSHPRIDVAVDRRVTRLTIEEGVVVGVATGDGDEVRGSATILACGGLGANKAMLAEYYPSALVAGEQMWYRGSDGAQGDGIFLGRQADAQIVGRDRGLRTLRPNAGVREQSSYLPGWLMLVNRLGRRFFDEMSPYSVTDPIAHAQGMPIWAIFDDAAKRASQPKSTFAYRKVAFADMPFEDWVEPVIDDMVARRACYTADSIQHLARRIGVPEDHLVTTVDKYNQDIERGYDSQFLKSPAVLKPITTAPFYAAEMRLLVVCLTSVGPRIDADSRVINEAGAAIPGLFAAGECVGGVLGDVYVGSGNSVANCVVYGRVAGQQAARLAAAAADLGTAD